MNDPMADAICAKQDRARRAMYDTAALSRTDERRRQEAIEIQQEPLLRRIVELENRVAALERRSDES